MISKSFTLFILVLTIVILSALYVTGLMIPIPMVLYFVAIGFGVMSYLLYRNILTANEKSPRRFVTAFMASITIKLLVTATFLGIFIYFNKEQKVPVAIGTAIIYFAHLFLFVRALTNETKS
ncbi:MAG: hypothetical protein R2809_02550 [Flavobacteriales bacterium]